MPRRRTPQELRTAYDATSDGLARGRLLVEARELLQRAATLQGATAIRDLFPFPEIVAAFESRWRWRINAVEAFEEYVEDLEAWLEALPSSSLFYFPEELYPSRLSYAVRAWARGRGTLSPDLARVRVVAAQRAILPTA